MKQKKIMSWKECDIEIGTPGTNDAFPADNALTNLGVIKDGTAELVSTAGDTLQARGTGGFLVAEEEGEGSYEIRARLIEPADSIYTLLGVGTVDGTSGDLQVKTHLVDGQFAVKVSPKNVGAKGIKAPLTSISFRPGRSDKEGDFLDLVFKMIYSDTLGYWYSRFTKPAPVSAGGGGSGSSTT